MAEQRYILVQATHRRAHRPKEMCRGQGTLCQCQVASAGTCDLAQVSPECWRTRLCAGERWGSRLYWSRPIRRAPATTTVCSAAISDALGLLGSDECPQPNRS